jgi:uncharacterized Zn finger protein
MPWYREFPPSKTIAAKGGIKARSRRGAFATSWWGRRWLDVLETLNLGGRLQRARAYARKGQVLNIDIEPGSVHADVQGSRPKPYRISIGVKQLATNETQRLAAELAKSPYFLAKLMTREMPQDIETLFDTARVSLFPSRASELRTDCSCPDWSNPCKHIAAVYYLLGEEFDRDPFLIFRLRGLDTTAMLATIGTAEIEPESRSDVQPEVGAWMLVPGQTAPESFWEGSRPEVDLTASAISDQTAAPLLRRLGNLPFWRGQHPLLDTLEPTYAAAANTALQILAGVD